MESIFGVIARILACDSWLEYFMRRIIGVGISQGFITSEIPTLIRASEIRVLLLASAAVFCIYSMVHATGKKLEPVKCFWLFAIHVCDTSVIAHDAIMYVTM